MAVFKFACPQCKQHIECDANYVGSQIDCPACRQAIIVPPVPPKVAAPEERSIQIKASTLRKTSLLGLCAVLVAGTVLVVVYALGNSTRTIWDEWSVLDGNEEQWSYAGGRIHAHSVDGESILASPKLYGDVTFSATVNTTNREASLAIRLQDAGNGYLILFAPARTPCPWNRTGFVSVIKKSTGNETTLAVFNKRKMSAIGQGARLKVIARGPSIEVQLNGTKILQVKGSTFVTGHLGLRMYGTPDFPCDAAFSSVTIH